MKLSMWMIVNQLRDFSLEIHIEDGSQTIGGVRFFLVEPDLKHEFLCIGDASNVISDVKYSDAIVLVHGYDIIFVLGIPVSLIRDNKVIGIHSFDTCGNCSCSPVQTVKPICH